MHRPGDVQYAVRRDGETVFTAADPADVWPFVDKNPRYEAAKRTATPTGWTAWAPLERDPKEG